MPIDPAIEAELAAHVESKGGYDLEQVDLGPAVVPGWDGFPTRKYRYEVRQGPAKLWGLVVLLDPTPAQVARWCWTAAVQAGSASPKTDACKLIDFAADQSGFQFPVRGVHIEAQDAKTLKVYPFFEGVTVQLKALGPQYPTTQPDEASLEAVIASTAADITKTGEYARIISTTRGEYTGAGGAAPVGGKAWPLIVGNLYRAAWGQDSNALINAKALTLVKRGKP